MLPMMAGLNTQIDLGVRENKRGAVWLMPGIDSHIWDDLYGMVGEHCALMDREELRQESAPPSQGEM